MPTHFLQNNYIFKLLAIALLVIFLMIPQLSLMGLISERASWRDQAYSSIEQSWPGQQVLAGPLLKIPYTLTYDIKEKVTEKDGTVREIISTTEQNDQLLIMPQQLEVANTLKSELRYRGIYAVPVYDSLFKVSGTFNSQALQELLNQHKDKQIKLGTPILSVLVNDQRGIAQVPRLSWQQREVEFKPGSRLGDASAGMHAFVPALNPASSEPVAFSFDLNLRGMAAMNVALLAENTQVNMMSDWPHPKFHGGLLPETRSVNEQGFSAQWRASSFSYNVSGALSNCQTQNQCRDLLNSTIGFELLQPVDSYQQAERSIKYALLFIVLTFVCLIMLELLKQLRVHPVQYTLVGLALIVFYLLLISLSEHMRFLNAYILAVLASTGLLTFYFGAILKSRRLGLMLGAGLVSLYAILYVILQAEDKALLMGSILIFIVLAALMLATRHFDWYALTNHSKAKTTASELAENGAVNQAHSA